MLADLVDASPDAVYALIGGVIVAIIASSATILVALINRREGKVTRGIADETRQQTERNEVLAREVAAAVMHVLDTGNGHTIGAAVSRLEDAASELANRVDAVEVIARESRDAAAQSADALLEHLKDVASDRKALFTMKAEWDAAKERLLNRRRKEDTP